MQVTYIGLGCVLTLWYTCFRWTILANKTVYAWAYAPINLVTAFSSIVFLIVSLFTIKESFTLWMLWLSIFLFIRNVYYTIEDVRDLIYMINNTGMFPPRIIFQQFVFVWLDIMMAIYVGWWFLKYKGIL